MPRRHDHRQGKRRRGSPLLLSVLITALSVLPLTACARSFVPHGPVPLAVEAAPPPESDQELIVQWLGTSSWIISRGRDVVVVDPFFSRPSMATVAASLVFGGLAPGFGYNVERINDVLPDLPAETKAVLIGHAHYDHVMDLAYYVKKKQGPKVPYVGGASAINILWSFRPVDFTPIEAVHATPRTIPGTPIRVISFDSDHAPHLLGISFLEGTVPSPPPSFPTTVGEYPVGEAKMYLIDFLGPRGENDIQWRVFINGAASTEGKANALAVYLASETPPRPPDVAILCVPGWDHVTRYPESLVEALKPRHVVLSHYDDFFSPYKNGEDPRPGKDMKFVLLADYYGFTARLEALKPKYEFDYYQPKTGQCLRFSGPLDRSSDPPLPCEE